MIGNFIFGAVVSFALAILSGPWCIKTLKHLNIGQKILDDGPTWHMSKQNTPTMGGFIFIIAVTVPVLLGIPFMVKHRDYRSVLILCLGLLFGIIGFIDDYTAIKKERNKGLSAGQKFLFQLVVAAVFLVVMRAMGYITPTLAIPFLGKEVQMSWLGYLPFSIFVIVGCDNSVNLTDGVDGLCASVTAVVAAFFCAVYFTINSSAILFSSALLGALLGFLKFNRHPAMVFMGDTGSLFLGGVVCAMAYACNMPLLLVPAGVIYIIETLSDIIQVAYFKLTHGRRIFRMAPIHHHLEMCGWGENKIVSVFTLVTVCSCLFGLWGFWQGLA